MNHYVIGVEIGGTKLQAALGTPSGKIVSIKQHKTEPSKGASEILKWLEEAIKKLLNQAQMKKASVDAIGIGFGGPVDYESNQLILSHQVNGWENFPLKAWVEERFNLPVLLENDSNAATWGEFCCGAARGAGNMAYMNIGSGIGGGLVIDGRLYRGSRRGAGEIGHTIVPVSDGRNGFHLMKLEDFCSGWAIEQRVQKSWPAKKYTPLFEYTKGNRKSITCKILAQAAQDGDKFAVKEIKQVAQLTGIAVANLITLFHPRVFVIGGGVALMGSILLDPLRKQVAKYVFKPFKGRYQIVPSKLGQRAVVVGALLLAGNRKQEEKSFS